MARTDSLYRQIRSLQRYHRDEVIPRDVEALVALGQTPIEQKFLRILHKVRSAPWYGFQVQYSVGRRFGDVMLNSRYGKTLIELDGEAFHTTLEDRQADINREAEIFSTEADVERIIRIPGHCLEHPMAVLAVLSKWEPTFATNTGYSAISFDRFIENDLPSPEHAQCSAGWRAWLDEMNFYELYHHSEVMSNVAFVFCLKEFLAKPRLKPMRLRKREWQPEVAKSDLLDEVICWSILQDDYKDKVLQTRF